MTEILFYHMERKTLEQVLPELVAKCVERNWPTLVVANSQERVESLDSLLWTYSDQTFLAHGKAGDGDEADQPVLLATSDNRVNKPEVCFLVDGSNTEELSEFSRIVHLLDGRSEDAIQAAREVWKGLDRDEHDVTYWLQDDAGRWVKKA